MAHLYLNCQSGISGDMFVGSLLDLLGNQKLLLRELKKLNLPNYTIKISTVTKKGIRATKFDVITGHEHAHRTLKDINAIIKKSALSADVKKLSKQIFLTLGKAEAKAHAVDISKVHFHEVGAIDSIVDIVSAAILIRSLNITKIYCGALTEGVGTVSIDHGQAQLPVPAVRELLQGITLTRVNIPKELITPTGAAILKTMNTIFVDSADTAEYKKGYGAGTRDLSIPNVAEAVLMNDDFGEKKILIETNIDDMNPEMFPYVIEKFMGLGAVDAWVQTCIMKKGRTGMLLSVLCEEKKKEEMIKTLFEETSTFGVRVRSIERVMLEREMKTVKTTYGAVQVKVGSYKGKKMSAKAEFEDAKVLALKHHVPLKEIYQEIYKQLDKKS